MRYLNVRVLLFVCLTTSALLWAAETDELRERAHAMQREAKALAERGREREAKQLTREARELMQVAERRRRKVSPEQDHRHALRERLDQLRDQLRELGAGKGNQEKRERLLMEAEEVEAVLGRYSKPQQSRPAERDELHQRLEHMRAAVEHLQHAGMGEVAELVMQRMKATEHELHEREQHMAEDPLRSILHQLEEMRHELQRLRDEVNELRRQR